MEENNISKYRDEVFDRVRHVVMTSMEFGYSFASRRIHNGRNFAAAAEDRLKGRGSIVVVWQIVVAIRHFAVA